MALIQEVFTKVDQLVNTFVAGGYSALAGELSPAVWAGFTLYVIVLGLAYLRQSYPFTFSDLAIRLMRAAIVVTLALNWGTFSAWAYNGLFAALQGLGNTLIAGISGAAPTNGGAIEAGFERILTGVATLMSSATGFKVPDISKIISALCLLVGGLLLYGAAIFVMLFSKVGFAITVVFAPAFIPFAMFDATKDIFGAWTRTVAGFVIIPALATCVLGFQLGVMDAQLTAAGTGDMNLKDAGMTLVLCIAFYLIMMQVPQIGGGMVGTVGVSGAATMAALFVNPAIRAGKMAASAVGGKAGLVAGKAAGAAWNKAKSGTSNAYSKARSALINRKAA